MPEQQQPSAEPREPDDLEQVMLESGIPITRETYISAAYWGGNAPKTVDWTGEHEAQLPDHLQDWSLFDDDGNYTGPPIDESVDDGSYDDVEDEEP